MQEPFDVYRRLRGIASELSFEDSFAAVWAHAQARQLVGFAFPEDVEQHQQLKNDPLSQPYAWQLEAIALEVILHGGDVSKNRRSLKRWNDMASAINALRATEDALHAQYLNSNNILHETLRIAHQQFLWQQRPGKRWISRYYQIFKGASVAQICLEQTGLSLEKIYALGTALWAHYAQKCFLGMPWTSSEPSISQEDIDRFFALYSADVYTLRQRIKVQRPRIDETFGYDNRTIRATPLVSFRKMGKTLVACPLPTLLVWRITAGLYYDLVDDPEFFNEFGASFQAYIGEVLRRATIGTQVRCLGEERFGTRNRTKDSVDWIMTDQSSAAFIECKSKRITVKSRTKLTDRSDILKDVDTLATFIVQLYETITHYRANRYPSLPFDESRAIFPVIVTPEDWFPLSKQFWTDLRERVDARLLLSCAPKAIVDELPFILMSSEELERAVQVVANASLREVFGGYRREEYSGWMFDRYLARAFPEFHGSVRDLFPETFDEIEASLT